MAIKENREYRSVAMTEFQADQEEDKYIVEGYASTWSPYELYDGINERIEPTAFADADFEDCCFLYNHEGMVYARTKNNSLEVSTDEHGLKVRANLGLTSAARELYETIKAGLIDQMSFAFIVREDEFEKATRTRIIRSIGKVFDVSAVSIPANASTQISARNYCNGVIAAEQAEKEAERLLEERNARIERIKNLIHTKENTDETC